MTGPLILASASPRRRELLSGIGVEFEVMPADIDESIPEHVTDMAEIARDLARQKAVAIAADHPDRDILAADTIVIDGEQILGKPATPDEARTMLRQLRDREHGVSTGVAIYTNGVVRLGHARTGVQMRDYTDEEIEASIERGDPFDKAGGYAIQDPVFKPVERFDGCYCNVVGLPLVASVTLLIEAGFRPRPPVGRFPTRCASCLQEADFR